MHREAGFAASIVAAMLFTACSGPSAPGAIPPGGESPGANAVRHRATAELRLKIPKRDRRQHYVSPATASIKISENGKSLGVFKTTASSGACSVTNGGTLCTFKLGVIPSGKAQFLVQAFDAVGNAVSSGTVTQAVVAGLNFIKVTLGGTVAKATLTIVNPNPPAGVAASSPLIVTAQDADGYTIVAPGNYANGSGAAAPIVLTDSDTSGATGFTVNGTASANVTGPSNVVAISYTGKSLGLATIGTTLAGTVTVQFAPRLTAIHDFMLPPGVATSAAMTPNAIVNGPDGNLYISVSSGASSNDAVLQMSTTGTVENTFQTGITPSTQLPAVQLTGLTVGPGPAIWYAGGGNVGSLTTGGVAANYLLATASGICSGDSAQQIVPSADGGVWVSVQCNTDSQIAHVTATGVVTVFPLTGFGGADGLIIGKDGNLYVAGHDDNTGAQALAQAPVIGAAIGTPIIVDVPSSGGNLIGLAQSADGLFWATTDGCGPSQMVRFHPGVPFNLTVAQSFSTISNCAAPGYPLALPDDSVWIPLSNYPIIERVLPVVFPSAPTLNDYPLPTAFGVPGRELKVTVGSDGNLWVLNSSEGSGNSGDVVQVAY